MFVLIIALGLFVRFYHFTDRIDFSYDSAENLIGAGYIARDHRPTLLGPPVGSRSLHGMYFHIGPTYTYILALLQVITRFDPILITGFFAVFNIGIGLLFFQIAQAKIGARIAQLALFFYVLDPLMIRFSLTIWNPILNFPVALFSWVLFPKHPLALGILSGLGIGFHYSYIILATLIALLLFLHKKPAIMPYLLGAVIGDLPFILFELRHEFHNSRALLAYLASSLAGKGNVHLTPIDFVWAWPAVLLGITFAVRFISRRQRAVGVILGLLLALGSLYTTFIAPKDLTTFGMPPGWTIHAVEREASIIAHDALGDFEVASLIKGDTRDYPIRYYLEFLFHKKPMAVEAYPQSSLLYVVARSEEQVKTGAVWELTAGGPFTIENVWPLQNDIELYKLRFLHASKPVPF